MAQVPHVVDPFEPAQKFDGMVWANPEEVIDEMVVTRIWDADAAEWLLVGGPGPQGGPGPAGPQGLTGAPGGLEEVDEFIHIQGPIGTWELDPHIVALVTLPIPVTWPSWKCHAQATMACNSALGLGDLDLWLRIDGVDQPAQQSKIVQNTLDERTVQGRRTGMTTTGARDVGLWAFHGSADNIALYDIMLYARAVNTA